MTIKSGQVWIETVLYTIIGLAIIGIVLAFVMPKINESKDNIIVEQSISAMKELDSKIKDVAKQEGNKGRIDFSMKRGYLYINSTSNSIFLGVEGLTSIYSEPGVEIEDGNLKIMTVEGQKSNSVFLTLNYAFNITYDGEDIEKKLTAAPLAYKIIIENKGNNQIDIKGG